MKNVMKVMGAAAVALAMFFSSNMDFKKNTGSVDLAALQPAHAWTNCLDWVPESIGEPDWFRVNHRFPMSEIVRIGVRGKNICMIGGWDICDALDIGVAQQEVRYGKFGEKSPDIPMN